MFNPHHYKKKLPSPVFKPSWVPKTSTPGVLFPKIDILSASCARHFSNQYSTALALH